MLKIEFYTELSPLSTKKLVEKVDYCGIKKRTDVLWRNNKNMVLSKNMEINIDIGVVKIHMKMYIQFEDE